MSDDKIQYDVHDYSPVNKYIEDQARLKRSASTWRYAKATALILVAVGILTVLLAWAYYLYKKPHRLVSLSEIEDRILSNEERIINNERKIPKENEVNTSTTENNLKSEINKKDQKILNLEEKLKNIDKQDTEIIAELKKNLEDIKNEKKKLQESLYEKRQVKTNVIHFQQIKTKLNNADVTVTTRLYYDDPTNLSPNKSDGSDPIECYVTFNRDDLQKIELGTKNEPPRVSKYHMETLGVSFKDFVNLKKSKCQLN